MAHSPAWHEVIMLYASCSLSPPDHCYSTSAYFSTRAHLLLAQLVVHTSTHLTLVSLFVLLCHSAAPRTLSLIHRATGSNYSLNSRDIEGAVSGWRPKSDLVGCIPADQRRHFRDINATHDILVRLFFRLLCFPCPFPHPTVPQIRWPHVQLAGPSCRRSWGNCSASMHV